MFYILYVLSMHDIFYVVRVVVSVFSMHDIFMWSKLLSMELAIPLVHVVYVVVMAYIICPFFTFIEDADLVSSFSSFALISFH